MPATLPQEVGKAQSGNSRCIFDILESLSFCFRLFPLSFFSIPYQKQLITELTWKFVRVNIKLTSSCTVLFVLILYFLYRIKKLLDF